jgi:hypothetical protein
MPLKLQHLLSFAIFLTSVFYSSEVTAQSWRWVVNADGNNQNANADIAVDNTGTQFIAGYFQKTLTLGDFTLESPDDYYSDLFLAKIDSGGRVIWAKAFELGKVYNNHIGICLGDSNNIYVTGSDDGKIFAAKYDSSGVLQWKSFIDADNSYGYGTDIAVNQNEEVYISVQENYGAMVAKLSYDGQVLWFNRVEGCHSNGVVANELAVDRLGNCYVTGPFNCDSIIIGSNILYNDSFYGTSYVAKYTPDGEVAWAKGIGGRTGENPQIAISALGNKILLANWFDGPITFDENTTVSPYITGPGSYLAQYDSSGHFLWAKNGSFFRSSPNDIAMDYDENIYLSGRNSDGGTNSFHWLKYNSNGDLVNSIDLLPGLCSGIDMDNNGNNYLVGTTTQRGLDIFEPDYSLSNSVFVAKLYTGGTTKKLINKPEIDRITTVCKGGVAPSSLYAEGENIQWYKDKELKNLLASTASYSPTLTTTDTFYVTQTINGIASWPKQVIIYFSTIPDFDIKHQQDSLYAPKDANYAYQWFRDSIPLADSVGGKLHGIKPAKLGKYTVVVNDRGCPKTASTFFYFDKCAGGVDSFQSNLSGYRYSWEVSTDGGQTFSSLVNNGNYTGVTTRTLTIKNIPVAWQKNLYRCLVNWTVYSNSYQLLFQSKWTGAVDNNWSNAGNWSCGLVPDIHTDILIGMGAVVIQSDAEARSVRIIDGATLTVMNGAKLTVIR